VHERQKLSEARHFLDRLRAATNTPDEFRFELSALLTAARSVLQYALEEAMTRPGGQRWYEDQQKANPVMKFLKDERDDNIHSKPVRPSMSVDVQARQTIGFSDSVSFKLTNAEGRLVQESVGSADPGPQATPDSPAEVLFTHTFSNWPDPNGEVVYLCELYVLSLAAFVNEGIGHGFITG